MNRLALLRRAFNRACDRLERARDAGRVSAADASVTFNKLYAAYRARKEDLELAGFLVRAGLKPSKHFEKLDRTLAKWAAGDNDFRPVPVNPITPKHAA